MHKKYIVFVLCILSCTIYGQTNLSGIINHYTSVNNIDYCESILTVSDIQNFQIGQEVLLIQMQGASINESNSSDFGAVTSMNSAGLYERSSIVNIIGNQIYLQYLLVNNYDIFGSLQLVTVPVYSDAMINDTLFAQPWNGTTGGVLALEVTGTLTVDHPIDVSGRGFRGGVAESINPNDCSWLSPQNDYFYNDNTWRGARKGEGIAFYIADKEAGKGAQANGGGGANDHNAGGGGGANQTSGGGGGDNDESSIFNCNGSHPGVGGKPLDGSNQRFFMGGAGGAGHMNNDAGTNGGDGGGIIFIKVNELMGSSIDIIASGAGSPQTAGADGGGGGGAGGSILIEVNQLNGSVNVNLSGGNGSTVNNANLDRCMGPGGGGSGGVLSTNLNVAADLIVDWEAGAPGLTINTPENCNNSTNGATAGTDGIEQSWEGFVMGSEEVLATAILNEPYDTTVCEEASLQFEIEAEGNGLEYQWQVDEGSGFMNLIDGGNYAGSQTNVLNIAAAEMIQDGFVFRCTIGSNCFADVLSTPFVLNVVEAADASFDFMVNGTVVTFNNTSQNTNASYTWDFGDSTTSFDVNPTHDYMMSGTYIVTLIADTGCGPVSFIEEVVIGVMPTANFNVDFNGGCIPLTVQFNNTSEGDVTTWNWSFPGGDPSTSAIQNPIVIYNTPGVYDVSLAVTNVAGSNSITYADFIQVVAVPAADFSWVANDLVVDFSNLSIDAGNYQWDFGDGSVLVFDENPTYTYMQAGIYEVSLVASNDFCESEITIMIEVMTTSTTELGAGLFEIYPVPFNDILVVDFKMNMGSIQLELFDLNGRLLLQKTLDGFSKYNLDLDQLTSGAYQLRLQNEMGTWVRKVVKAN